MARVFSTGVEVPTAGDRHPSEAWWGRIGATTNAAILNETGKARADSAAAVDALRKTVTQDYVDRATASQYGIPGPASTISIGTVQVGAVAAASMSGTAPNQKLNLVFSPGPEGPQGPGGAFELAATSDEGLFEVTEKPAGADIAERDITALAPGVTAGKIYISRYGPLVTLQFDGVVVKPDQTSYKMFTDIIGPGFLPTRNVDFRTAPRTTTEHLDTAVVYTSGNIVIYKYASDQVIRGVWTWRTAQPFPSTLPGMPA